ncbi:MAG: hypothetical protein MZW92_54085 [Comamonadaceae bacterium]|nr:hypothetical protein [Comamonadaceae bacterium]
MVSRLTDAEGPRPGAARRCRAAGRDGVQLARARQRRPGARSGLAQRRAAASGQRRACSIGYDEALCAPASSPAPT